MMIRMVIFFVLCFGTVCVTGSRQRLPDPWSLDPKPFDKWGLLIEDESNVKKDSTTRASGCVLWLYKGWVLAGKNYSKGNVIDWKDVWIPFSLRDSRVFLKWSRQKYFRRIVAPSRLPDEFTKNSGEYIFNQNSKHGQDNSDSSYLHKLLFSPALDAPLECHESLWNTNLQMDGINNNDCNAIDSNCSVSTSLGPVLQVSRPLAVGDPIFLACDGNIESHNSPAKEALEDFPFFKSMKKTMEKHGTCLDPSIRIAPSMIPNGGGWGSFATRSFSKGETLSSGFAIHLHRRELLNVAREDDVTEDGPTYPDTLINYCYGHPRSDLLLLPNVHGANTINHASSPDKINVTLKWIKSSAYSADAPARFFEENVNKSTDVLFGETETSQFSVQIIALRRINEGEELFSDYGRLWEQAWTRYQNEISTTTIANNNIPFFRHEIGLPESFFSPAWLEFEEQNRVKQSRKEYDDQLYLPELGVGHVERVMVKKSNTNHDAFTFLNLDDSVTSIEETIPLSENGTFRVGLPNELIVAMSDWATQRMGLTDLLRSYIMGRDHRGEDHSIGEGQRINGGAWWVHQINQEMEWNMHSITPDDDLSFSQFLDALSDASFDNVLEGIGNRFSLPSLTIYFLSFRAFSYVSELPLYSGSEHEGVFNLIFPIRLEQDGAGNMPGVREYPDLILADSSQKKMLPYHYESRHAILLHKNGYYGTAPCDYRGQLNETTGFMNSGMRMIVSIHFGDFSNKTFRQKFVEEWEDATYLASEYPVEEDREEYLRSYTHWKAKDRSKTIKTPVTN